MGHQVTARTWPSVASRTKLIITSRKINSMENELTALERANMEFAEAIETGGTQVAMAAADDICIESRAAFIAFLDDCAWSHNVNLNAKCKLTSLLNQSKSGLERLLRDQPGESCGLLSDYLAAIVDRINDVESYELEPIGFK